MNEHDGRRGDAPQIMVVDDTPASLHLMAEILMNHGYQVRLASSGRLALRSTAIEAPDLILLDVKMPDMDGYEVCRRLKSEKESMGIPVIFVSALDEAADKLTGFDAGGADFITKPYQPAEVLARIETHLALRRLQREMETQNARLQVEIAERQRAEEGIRRLNAGLEHEVEERTRQLFDAREELVRKEKLAVLGRLSGSVGHELRNPLGVISNAVYFLKMVQADGDETTKEYLNIIENEIDNSLRIITDLLDFARTRPPQITAVTVRDLTDESLRRCVIPDDVDLQTEVPDDLPLLRVDPLQMGQVLTNLITNAVQAMPKGGALRVAARIVAAGLAPAQAGCPQGAPIQDFIAISVTDSGEGISPENMTKLFQPLFTTKAKGIGLGLVVCRNLVESNGGGIEVESEPGKGTCFTVKLPVDEGGR